MEKPRKKCARCGKTFSVNKDGRLQKHQGTEPHPLGHRMLVCLQAGTDTAESIRLIT